MNHLDAAPSHGSHISKDEANRFEGNKADIDNERLRILPRKGPPVPDLSE